jgi:DNA-binding transcriptional MerR regulator
MPGAAAAPNPRPAPDALPALRRPGARLDHRTDARDGRRSTPARDAQPEANRRDDGTQTIMALKFTVDSLDSIPEPQRALYAKTEDGKWRLDLDGYEDPTGLKRALDAERDQKRDAVKLSKAWKDLGKTPEEIQELLEQKAQADRDKLTKAGEWDKLKAQISEAHAAELAKREERNGLLTKQLERHLVDAAATAALAAASGSSELLLPHVKARTKVVEENGEFVVRVVDASGNPRVDGKGEFLSIKDLVSEMRQSEVFLPAFKASGTSGGGAPNNGLPSGGARLQGKVDGTEQERAAYFASKFNLPTP